jgi:hypothetical protein
MLSGQGRLFVGIPGAKIVSVEPLDVVTTYRRRFKK